MAHTPGPWKKVFIPKSIYRGYDLYEIQFGKDGECVAELVHKESDADLFAVAPEMLELLEELSEIIYEENGLPFISASYDSGVIKRLIAKAKGEI